MFFVKLIYNLFISSNRGKFAVVKKVGSKHSGETYAAKLVKYDEDTVEVTKKEFEIWKELDHPNLVLLHDAFFVRKYLILICDIVSGQDVLMYMANLPAPTEDDVAGAIKQLLEALDYLHQINICHLDVKVCAPLLFMLCVLKLFNIIYCLANFYFYILNT